MEGPHRLVVDLMGARHALPMAEFGAVNRGGIRSIRSSQYSEDVVADAYDWLRANIMPLLRAAQTHWPRVGIVFGMAGSRNLFHLNEGDDLVYFGRSKGL